MPPTDLFHNSSNVQPNAIQLKVIIVFHFGLLWGFYITSSCIQLFHILQVFVNHILHVYSTSMISHCVLFLHGQTICLTSLANVDACAFLYVMSILY